MNKVAIVFGVIALLIVLYSYQAEGYAYIFEQSDDIDLRISCFDSSEYPCNNTVSCHVTVFQPDSSVLVSNGTMTHNPTYYNYSLNTTQTSVAGEYSVIAYCTIDDYSSFTYKVTPNGSEVSEGDSALYVALLILVMIMFGLSIYGVFNARNSTAKYSYLGVAYLLFIGITFIAWNIANNFLWAVTGLNTFLWVLFRISWMMALPFFVLSFIFYLFEFRKLKQIQSLIERGVPEDEAMKRVGKKW